MPQIEPTMPEKREKIQLVMAEDDARFLRDLALEAGVTQGYALHLLLEMLQLMVGAARENGTLEGYKMPALEAYVGLTLHQMGLLADDEFTRAAIAADVMNGERAAMRLAGLGALANERLDQLKPIWEASRAEAAQRRDQWTAERAWLAQQITRVNPTAGAAD